MLTERAKMLAGELYVSADPELVALRQRARLAREALRVAVLAGPDGVHAALHALLGAAGEGAWIEPPFHCDYGINITMGARAYANAGCVFLDPAPITIGDDVLIASGVQLLTATHPLDAATRISGVELARAITIGARAWLGAGALVLPGVSIGEEAVIGAGAVVTRDVPARTLAVGNPARVLRSL